MSDRIAVMRAGRIEQLGPPEELYERPRTAFVAGFLGVSNLLDGEIRGRNDGLVEVRLQDGAVVRVPDDGQPGSGPVRIGVRPEKLRVAGVGAGGRAEPEEAANELEGTVLDASYVGVSTQYIVRTDDGHRLVVYEQNLETSGSTAARADGERVRVSWRPRHTFVIDMTQDRPHDHGVLEEEATA